MYLLVMPKYWGKNYFAHGSFPEVGQKQKMEKKIARKSAFLRKKKKLPKKNIFFCIYILVMPKYLGGNYCGSKAKNGEKEREKARKKD